MSVQSTPFYWLLCDRCGVRSTEGQEYAAWMDQDQAEEMAIEYDWLVTDDGHHYCNDCTTWDDDTDEQVAKPPIETAP